MYTISTNMWQLAALVAVMLPSAALADWFGLRNDTQSVVVVQQAFVVDGKVSPSRPVLLYPGEVTWDSVIRHGERSIAIYDPRQPQRALHQTKIPYGGHSLLYSVKPGTLGQVRLEKQKKP